LLRLIDAINEKIGSYTGFLLVIMTFMMTWEVVARRFFNSPTSWAWPLCVQLQLVVAALSGGYCLLHKAHVRMDVFYSRLSPKKQAIMDLATFVFVLIFLGVAMWRATEMGLLSFSVLETANVGFKPPIWHLKLIIIPSGILLFLLQEIAQFIRNLRVARGRGQ
jgi:TRAP-type mannitol/chloroaromatic compound transport system permease small subunit